MNNKITPINKEIELDEHTLLVSKMTLNGEITYCSEDYLNIIGYKLDELLGAKHSLFRHPDMPVVIYEKLWENLDNNREFNGYFKNINKDGSYYWCFANVTPSYNLNNERIGFYLVQRKSDIEKLNYIKNLYLELREIESQSANSNPTTDSKYKLDSVLNGREMGYDEFVFSI